MEQNKLVIFLSIIIIIIIVLLQYNSLIKLKAKVKRSKSGIDIYYKQRFDLIPNLIATVKEYANYEKSTYENITKLRNIYVQTKDIKIGENLNNKINEIMLLTQNYPKLNANENFLNLQKNLEKMESQLQAARRIYNNDATKYNTKIKTIPFNIMAKIFNFREEPLFELSNEQIHNN